MFLFPRLAVRNILRKPGRSFTICAVLALGVFVIIIIRSLVDGIELDTCRLIIDTDCSHLEIFQVKHGWERRRNPLGNLLRQGDRLAEWISKDDNVLGVSPRLVFPARLCDGVDVIPCIAVGIHPGLDDKVFSRRRIKRGKPLGGSESDGLLVGSNLAASMELKVGAMVTLLSVTGEGTLTAYDFPVRGIIECGNPRVDGQQVLLPIGAAREMLALEDDEVSSIYVKTRRISTDYRSIVGRAAKRSDQHLSSYSWVHYTKGERRVSNRRRAGMAFIVLFIALLVALTFANALLMAAYERSSEIGTLLALGFRRRQVLLLFVIESAVIGLFAAIVGCLGGALVSHYLQVYGVPYSLGQEQLELAVPQRIHAYYSWSTVLDAFLFALLLSFGTSFYPAWRATLVEPADALRRV